MPRTSRSVAQRLAAQQSAKSKKRRSPRTVTPAPEGSATPPAPSSLESPSTPSMAEILDEVVPTEGGSRAASMSALAPAAPTTRTTTSNRPTTTGTRRGTASRATSRPVAPRRRYSEYAEEYSYVGADLRRIVVVAVVLIVLLIGLSFFIQ